jgi:hypothetical protein
MIYFFGDGEEGREVKGRKFVEGSRGLEMVGGEKGTG